MAVVSVSYDVRVNGTRYTVLFSDIPRYYIEISLLENGLHYIYFVVVDGALSLVSSTDEWDLSDLTIVPVATVLKEDATTYTLVDKRYNYLADPKASHFLANAEEYDLNDVMIPALDSYNEDLGEIDDAKFTWLGATAKSVKSFIIKLLDFIYAVVLIEPVLEESGSFTLGITHNLKGVRANYATDINCTIPTNNSVPFEIGTFIPLQQIGNGAITVIGADGTVIIVGDPITAGITKMVGLWKTDTNTWQVIGGTT